MAEDKHSESVAATKESLEKNTAVKEIGENINNMRNLPKGPLLMAINILMIASSLFHIYTGGFGMLSTLDQRSIHLLLMLTPSFFMYAATPRLSRKVQWIDYIFALLSIAGCTYILLTWRHNTFRIGDPSLSAKVLGTALIRTSSPKDGNWFWAA